MREIDALERLKDHQNIVQLYDLFKDKQDSSKLFMVFEFMEGGDLRSHIRKRYSGAGMPIGMVICFTEQLLKATLHVHLNGYIHRDIKSHNIVLGEPGSFINADGTASQYDRVLKLCDFGLSRVSPLPPKAMTKEISTLNWRAPEVILDNLRYNVSVDMWSIGVVIFEMLTG